MCMCGLMIGYLPHVRVGERIIYCDMESVVLVGLNECSGKNAVDDNSSAREAVRGNDTVLEIEHIAHVCSECGHGSQQKR